MVVRHANGIEKSPVLNEMNVTDMIVAFGKKVRVPGAIFSLLLIRNVSFRTKLVGFRLIAAFCTGWMLHFPIYFLFG